MDTCEIKGGVDLSGGAIDRLGNLHIRRWSPMPDCHVAETLDGFEPAKCTNHQYNH